MELGNWHNYNWRSTYTEAKAYDSAIKYSAISFRFYPVNEFNEFEFPKLKDYFAPFRYTLKLRVISDAAMPELERIEAFTDSVVETRAVRLVWDKAPAPTLKLDAFNGAVEGLDKLSPTNFLAHLQVAVNPDPNTFDRTLVTVRNEKETFTFAVDDLAKGPVFLPGYGVAVLPDSDERDYAAVAAEQKARGAKTLYDRVSELPEQTWRSAWAGMPPKKSPIYFPLGLDGGRQRFRLDPLPLKRWLPQATAGSRHAATEPRAVTDAGELQPAWAARASDARRGEPADLRDNVGRGRRPRAADGFCYAAGRRQGRRPRSAGRCLHGLHGAIHVH